MAFLEMKFYSQELKKQTMVNVILPDAKKREEIGRIRTLYLLHGFRGSQSDWVFKSGLLRYVQKLPLAVVMPAGNNSCFQVKFVCPTLVLGGCQLCDFI